VADIRRILLDGYATVMVRDGEHLVARDGRTVAVDQAVHLPPVEPTKIICCHLNHVSRVKEFGVSLPPAPTYFHKPVSALNAHGAAVVRPSTCKWLNFEGEVAAATSATPKRATTSPATRWPTTTACTTSATPTAARCCG
jgi:5-oxopent-3-ene-1,2,5-tricarboxylate decarboxylase/2-hydroxyhepta-2,4-diene-1,7-dioate isomerase